MNQFIALIPSLEPNDLLEPLLKELKANKFDIIVIDDGSGKNYENIFNQAKKYAHVISYPINKGKGYALKTGLKYIKENYKDDYIIVTMDSDGQHKVSDAKKLCEYCLKHEDTLVLGKRLRNENTPIRSKIGNRITRFVYKINTGVDIYDTQTGLRAFSNKLMDYMLSIEGNRYEYEMNVLLYLNKYSIKYKEIEIETIYLNNNKGSHFNGIKDSYRVYKEIFKYIFRSKKGK